MQSSRIVISVVSHGQGRLIKQLLADIALHERKTLPVVVLTLNIPEAFSIGADEFPFEIHILNNGSPKGFGANHNAAFDWSRAHLQFEFFCVINPDVRLTDSVLQHLCDGFPDQVGLVAPLILESDGHPEQRRRILPTPWYILRKSLGISRLNPGVSDQVATWVSGAFMMFRRATFERVNGFDPRFFMYYEDVDLCCRLRLNRLAVQVLPGVTVVHDGQRTSHRRLRYFIWHMRSMLRFFFSRIFVRCWLAQRRGQNHERT